MNRSVLSLPSVRILGPEEALIRAEERQQDRSDRGIASHRLTGPAVPHSTAEGHEMAARQRATSIAPSAGRDPTQVQIAAAKSVALHTARTVFDSFRVRDGRSIGDVRWHEIERLRATNAQEASSVLWQLQRHCVPANQDAKVREVVKAAELERMIQRAAEPTPKQRVDRLRNDMRRMGADMTPADMPAPERVLKSDLAAEAVTEIVVDWAPPADNPEGEPEPTPRRVLKGVAVRDRSATAISRLKRFNGLSKQQLAAGVRFERDWETAGLERRMIANLEGMGGGCGDGPEGARLDALGRTRRAVEALARAGAPTLKVITAIVIHGQRGTDAAADAYADKPRRQAHASALLATGLSLLDSHYRSGRSK